MFIGAGLLLASACCSLLIAEGKKPAMRRGMCPPVDATLAGRLMRSPKLKAGSGRLTIVAVIEGRAFGQAFLIFQQDRRIQKHAV